MRLSTSFGASIVVRGVRRVMGKPFAGDIWEDIYREEARTISACAPAERFSKSFQAYLDSRLTLDDLMASKEKEEKKRCERARSDVVDVSAAA